MWMDIDKPRGSENESRWMEGSGKSHKMHVCMPMSNSELNRKKKKNKNSA